MRNIYKIMERFYQSLICAGLLIIFTKTAHAYLDPGSGSYIFQVLIGGILGITVGIKNYWKKMWQSLIKIFRKPEKSHNDEEQDNSS